MTDPLFEIKLLASLDHAQFEEAIWTFEIDGDISTLLLIDYALEQFHQKKVQADKVYRVSEQKNKKIGEQYLGLEKNESYTFAQLLQFVIFTQANDVKDALSNILFDSVEQAQLILSKRAENYKLTLKAPNQLKNLFLLVKHIYSYPAELKKLFFIKTLFFKNKVYQPITPLLAHPVLTSVLYLSHTFRQIYITYSEQNQSIGFFSFLDDIHRLEHLVPYYHFFQEKYVEAKKCSSQTGIINILGDTYFGEMYTEKRKSRGQTDALQQYGYHYSFQKIQPFLGKNDINIANFEAVFSLENQSPLKDKKPFILKADAKKTLEELKSIHLNYLVLANNHLKDYGDEGLAHTLQQLDQASIAYIGAGLNQKDAHNYFEIAFEAKHYAIFNGYWHRDSAYLDYDFYALGSRSGVACLNAVLLE